MQAKSLNDCSKLDTAAAADSDMNTIRIGNRFVDKPAQTQESLHSKEVWLATAHAMQEQDGELLITDGPFAETKEM